MLRPQLRRVRRRGLRGAQGRQGALLRHGPHVRQRHVRPRGTDGLPTAAARHRPAQSAVEQVRTLTLTLTLFLTPVPNPYPYL